MPRNMKYFIYCLFIIIALLIFIIKFPEFANNGSYMKLKKFKEKI